MITLKRYLDEPATADVPAAAPRPVLDPYAALLAAIADCAPQVCARLGLEFQSKLMQLRQRLTRNATPEERASTHGQAEAELRQWGGKVAEYYQQKASEVKDLMMVVTRAAESVGERDQRYANQFTSLSGNLSSIANLEDLTKLRGALVQKVMELKSGVERMKKESQESLAQLRSEVSTYRERLEESERVATVDPLTGIANRRKVELALEAIVDQGRPFCVLMCDLNGFKQVNDKYGHVCGDELLKRFATELSQAVRSTDLAGRWGGDEFITLFDCGLRHAEAQRERIKRYVFGKYTLTLAYGTQEIQVEAGIGLVEWQPGETITQLIARADSAMYLDKATKKAPQPEAAIPATHVLSDR